MGRDVYIKIKDLREWENNVRIHTKRNLEALKQSLRAFKQTKPILVQKSTYRIIAGNGTYQAAVALGWEEIECRLFDVDDETAEAMMIADNRTGELSEWDEGNLVEGLKRLQDVGKLDIVGYDTLELEKMIAYQEGDLYEKLSPKNEDKKVVPEDFPAPAEPKIQENTAPEQKEKEDTSDIPAVSSYEDQISFIVNGFAFVLSDPAEIEEIRCLTEILKDAPEKERKEVNREVFASIREILTNKFMR